MCVCVRERQSSFCSKLMSPQSPATLYLPLEPRYHYTCFPIKLNSLHVLILLLIGFMFLLPSFILRYCIPEYLHDRDPASINFKGSQLILFFFFLYQIKYCSPVSVFYIRYSDFIVCFALSLYITMVFFQQTIRCYL